MDGPNHAALVQAFALCSAAFAALTAVLGKVAVGEVNSNLATLIRTVVTSLWPPRSSPPAGRGSRWGSSPG